LVRKEVKGKMNFAKKITALVLAGTLVFGGSFTAFAEESTAASGSPTKPVVVEKTEDTETRIAKSVDIDVMSDDTVSITKITVNDPEQKFANVLEISSLKSGKDGEEYPVSSVGKGAISGTDIKIVHINPQSETFTLNEGALAGADKLKKVTIKPEKKRTKVTIKKNSLGSAKKLELDNVKADNLKIKKGSVNKLKTVFIGENVSKKEQKKIEKKLKKAGFKGKIKKK
jgi:hypothetical protein